MTRSAHETFLSLICGLPLPTRKERLFCMLTGYFDGSTEDGDVLIYAGYLGRADDWMCFSDGWEELLPKNPRKPFKMNKAAKTARGRSETISHYQLIERTKVIAVGCAIPIEPLKRVVRELGIPPTWENPFLFAWPTIITAAMMGAKHFGSDEPIKFIFDDQTDKVHLRQAWPYYIETARRSVRKKIVGEPAFEKDDFLNPLQAADFVAWWARKQYIRDRSRMKDLFPVEWTGGKEPKLFFVVAEEEMIRVQLIKNIEATERKKSELRMSATFHSVPSLLKKPLS